MHAYKHTCNQVGDLSEFNQCQTRLWQLYKDDVSLRTNIAEFYCYRLFYFIFTDNKNAMGAALKDIIALKKTSPQLNTDSDSDSDSDLSRAVTAGKDECADGKDGTRNAAKAPVSGVSQVGGSTADKRGAASASKSKARHGTKKQATITDNTGTAGGGGGSASLDPALMFKSLMRRPSRTLRFISSIRQALLLNNFIAVFAYFQRAKHVHDHYQRTQNIATDTAAATIAANGNANDKASDAAKGAVDTIAAIEGEGAADASFIPSHTVFLINCFIPKVSEAGRSFVVNLQS